MEDLDFSSVSPAPCTAGEQPHGTPPLMGSSFREAVCEGVYVCEDVSVHVLGCACV